MFPRPARTAFASVRSRILGLVLVPLLCLVVVAGQQATAKRSAVHTAERSRDIVVAYLEVGRLRAGMQLEYAATSGMTKMIAAGFAPTAPSTTALIGFDTAGTATRYAAQNDGCVLELETMLPELGIASVGELRAILDPRAGLAEDVAANGMLADPGALVERVDGTYRRIDGRLGALQQALRRELLDSAVGRGEAWDRLRAELAVADDIVVWVNAVATETRLLTAASTIGASRALDVYELGAARIAELESRDRLRVSALAPLVDLDRPEQQRWESARKAAADAAGISRAAVDDDAAFPAGATRIRLPAAGSATEALASVAVAVAVATGGIDLADQAVGSLDAVTRRADATVEQIVGSAARSELISLVLLAGAIAASFMVAIVTTRGLTRPLAALTRQANAIRDGEFAAVPRSAREPAEVAVVGDALDELAANLSLLTQQAAALGAGRLNDPRLARSVPGKLGESLRSSVGRLSELTERLARQARRDPMTGLANRAAVVDRLEEALQRAQRSGHPVGLLYVDLDEFKSVNDAFGHEQGDALLRVVAQRLEHFATGDRMTGRLGADEFVVVVEDDGVASLLVAFGEELVAAVQQPVELKGSTYRLSVSVGVALSRPGQDPSGLLRDAGQATVDAKRHGKGRVQAFDPAMQEALERRARVQHDLRRAIAEDEFELFLQPVIETASGRVEGAEGLIRWRLGDGTIVPPNDFIPIAEQSALIIDIGRLVIDKACRQLAQWSLAGREDLHVAINVGGRHVTDGTLTEDIRSQLDHHGVRADQLVVELTESNLVSDLELAAAVLEELRALGVRIALDDFGTGYSSLSYLRRLPIDTMKLDRSYVNGLGSDEQETSIVRSLVQLAESLDLDVVAEGVETDEQLEHLRRLGCKSVQGYLLARPMPPAQFDHWLSARSATDAAAGTEVEAVGNAA